MATLTRRAGSLALLVFLISAPSAHGQEHIKPHAEWEERFIYPVVDRLAGGVGRWIAELRAEADKPRLDAARFVRRADNLLGLIWAHFEEEEEVLLPLIDQGMTRARFERELGEAGQPTDAPRAGAQGREDT